MTDDAVLAAVAAEAEWMEDLLVRLVATTATTDARHFVRAGIPAVCFGPRAERIHGIDERVSLRSVVESAQVLGLFIRGWCVLVRDLDREEER